VVIDRETLVHGSAEREYSRIARAIGQISGFGKFVARLQTQQREGGYSLILAVRGLMRQCVVAGLNNRLQRWYFTSGNSEN
jgi:hypothetical protein